MNMQDFDPINPMPEEPTPVNEPAPASEPAPVDEPAPVVEPTAVNESIPTQQPAPVEESAPVVQPTPPEPSASSPGPAPAYPPVWQPFTPAQPFTPPVPVAPKKKSKGLRIFAGVLAGVILFIAGISGGYLAGLKNNQNNTDTQPGWEQNQTPSGDDTTTGEKSQFDIATGETGDVIYSYEQIVKTVSKSIVNITIYAADGSAGSYASGIIMDAGKGYVLTNDHIYSDVPNAKFLITLNDKTEFKATFVSGDSRSDIAILKIENPKNLVAATFSTTPVAVGERVLAIGQSYGYADTVSEGIVSAANRRVSLSSGSYSESYIQTTAAINPGNSGGALVNMAGQVVGVTSAKIATQEVEGLGFAIPVNKALSIVQNLQKNGKVVGRAKLGITYTEMNTVAAEVNGCPVGLYVQTVDETADIYKKGVTEGDVITHVNGKEINISTVLLDVIDTATAGDTLTLTIYKGKTKTSKNITVTLSEAESTNSYVTRSQTQDKNQGNDLPENPFDFYFDN